LKIAEPQCRSVPVADALPQRSHKQRVWPQAALWIRLFLLCSSFLFFLLYLDGCAWSDRIVYTNEPFTFPRENPNNSQLAQGNDDAMMIAMASSV
jgi:hypothetical protein